MNTKYGVRFPEPTVEEPTDDELEEMVMGLTMAPVTATDGCEVEPDGECPHGHVSWPRYKGVM